MTDENQFPEPAPAPVLVEDVATSLLRVWGRLNELDAKALRELVLLTKDLEHDDPVFQLLFALGCYNNLLEYFPERMRDILELAKEQVLAKAVEVNSELADFVKQLPIQTKEELVEFLNSSAGAKVLARSFAPTIQLLEQKVNAIAVENKSMSDRTARLGATATSLDLVVKLLQGTVSSLETAKDSLNSADAQRQADSAAALGRMEAVAIQTEATRSKLETIGRRAMWLVVGAVGLMLFAVAGVEWRERQTRPEIKIQQTFRELGIDMMVKKDQSGLEVRFHSASPGLYLAPTGTISVNRDMVVTYPELQLAQ